MTNKEYRAHEGISKSSLWEINKSPLHFKFRQDNPQKDTPALIFGRAVHKWILEEETFFDEYAIQEDFALNSIAGCDSAIKYFSKIGDGFDSSVYLNLSFREKQSIIPTLKNNYDIGFITQEDFEIIKTMKTELLKNEMAVALLKGKKEVSLFGVDELTGEKIKARPDILTEIGEQLIIVDYKSCDSAETESFMRSSLKYGYHLQDAMYSEVVKQNYGKEPIFIFIAQEKTEPYAVNILQTDQYFRQYGNDVFRELIGIFHECKATGNWYGYETSFNQVNNLSLPEWLLKRME